MTYILAAKCKDGVVFVTDRKTMNLTKNTFEWVDEKVLRISLQVVIAWSGLGSYFDPFSRRFTEQIKNDPNPTPNEYLNAFEKAFEEVRKTFPDEISNGGLAILIGVQKDEGAALFLIEGNGGARIIEKYHSIGTSQPIGEFFLRKLWDDAMSMEDFAKLATFCITYVDKYDLDVSVGLNGKQAPIWTIPDAPPPPSYSNIGKAPQRVLDECGRYADEKIKKIDNLIADWSNP
jgi:20S proteasome alpha/beta subunit